MLPLLFQVEAVSTSVQDSSVLVQRSTLDLILFCFPFHMSQVLVTKAIFFIHCQCLIPNHSLKKYLVKSKEPHKLAELIYEQQQKWNCFHCSSHGFCFTQELISDQLDRNFSFALTFINNAIWYCAFTLQFGIHMKTICSLFLFSCNFLSGVNMLKLR